MKEKITNMWKLVHGSSTRTNYANDAFIAYFTIISRNMYLQLSACNNGVLKTLRQIAEIVFLLSFCCAIFMNFVGTPKSTSLGGL